MDSYGIEEARNQLGDLIDRVRLSGERIALTRYGKPAVVLVSAQWHEQAEAAISGEDAPAVSR